MEKSTKLERNELFKMPIIENDDEELVLAERKRLKRSSKRTWQKVQQSFSQFLIPDKTIYPKAKYVDDNSICNVSTKEQVLEDNSVKITAFKYVINFLMLRAKDRKFNISVAKLIHAIDIALIVSDDQVDVDIVQTSANRWNSVAIDIAVKQLFNEGILRTGLAKGKYNCTYSSDQANTLYKNCTDLEKVLASNLEKVYTRLENGTKPNLHELVDTVYDDLNV